MKKRILLIVVIILVVIQFIKPEKNISNKAQPNNISSVYTVPEDIKTILEKSCNDCHSNNTVYPWYASIQPVAWWLNDHIEEGKRELNFDEFATYRIARQYKKLEEVQKQVKEGEMPLTSYTFVHTNSKLSEQQKQALINWAETIRSTIKSKYPADSLVLPKRPSKTE